MPDRCILLVFRASPDGQEERACFRVASKEGELICAIPRPLPVSFFLLVGEVIPPRTSWRGRLDLSVVLGMLEPGVWFSSKWRSGGISSQLQVCGLGVGVGLLSILAADCAGAVGSI